MYNNLYNRLPSQVVVSLASEDLHLYAYSHLAYALVQVREREREGRR